MTLLSIVQQASDVIGIPRTTQVVGSNDMQVRQLLALVNQDGKDLARRYTWQQLTKERQFTTTATEVQTGAIPADFDRFVDGTIYNRSKTERAFGPVTPEEYQEFKSRLSVVAVDAFRVRGSDFLIIPTPAVGDNWVFEYISTYWVRAEGETAGSKTAFSLDSDVSLFSIDLHILGLVWRYKRSRGLDYAEDFAAYEALFKMMTGRDGGRRIIDMGQQPMRRAPIPAGIVVVSSSGSSVTPDPEPVAPEQLS